jgi:heterodisulfide reductase subunit C
MTSLSEKLIYTPAAANAFAHEVEETAGTSIMLCFQCQKCTAGCPVAASTDMKVHEIIRLVQLGARDEVLSSRMIWECTSCETCGARCPQGVDLPAIIDALRRLSRADKKVTPGTVVPAFNEVFLGTVRQMGRVHELGLMAAFKLRTKKFLQDMGKLPTMLRKGKFALLPTFVRGRAERKRLFRRAQGSGGGKR